MKCKCVSTFLSGIECFHIWIQCQKAKFKKKPMYLQYNQVESLQIFVFCVGNQMLFFWRLFNYYTICIIVLTTQVSVSHQKQVYYNGLLCISRVHTTHTWQYFVVINSEVGCFSPWGLIIGHCNLESRVARLGECFVGFVD